ncbi:DUF6085 family protein [Streptomyces sp. NPDC087525]|uniref:DUF6085 family protein n=1 Tax=Streptomyces sp. NPDC087525 TaxID=3365793 RepID=UPI003822AE38
MPDPTRLVVRAIDALTTQARRVADHQTAPVATDPEPDDDTDNTPHCYTTVQGHCPACRGTSLFLGSGGYVTCSRLDCPEPDAASTLLERKPDATTAIQRHTADTITDDALDQLYAERARLTTELANEQDVSRRLLDQRQEMAAERYAWQERGNKAERRAEFAERDLHILRTGLRAAGGDPTNIQNLWAQIRLRNRQWRETKQEAREAEAVIGRVREVSTAMMERITTVTERPADEK